MNLTWAQSPRIKIKPTASNLLKFPWPWKKCNTKHVAHALNYDMFQMALGFRLSLSIEPGFICGVDHRKKKTKGFWTERKIRFWGWKTSKAQFGIFCRMPNVVMGKSATTDSTRRAWKGPFQPQTCGMSYHLPNSKALDFNGSSTLRRKKETTKLEPSLLSILAQTSITCPSTPTKKESPQSWRKKWWVLLFHRITTSELTEMTSEIVTTAFSEPKGLCKKKINSQIKPKWCWPL